MKKDNVNCVKFNNLPKGIKIKKQLSEFDESVYNAVCRLYDNGNWLLTMKEICFAMGNIEPTESELKNVYFSIQEIRQTWGKKRIGKGNNRIECDFPLLACDLINSYDLEKCKVRVTCEPNIYVYVCNAEAVEKIEKQCLFRLGGSDEVFQILSDYINSIDRLRKQYDIGSIFDFMNQNKIVGA